MVPWMIEKRTTARAFHEADGVEDWRVLFSGAHAYFRVTSFEEGARLVAAIAEVAEAYDISEVAVIAALLYYDRHRAPIDTVLQTNAAITD